MPVPPKWVSFYAQNSLNKGPVSVQFSLEESLWLKFEENVKNSSFPPEFIIRVGMKASFDSKKRVAF